MPIRSVNCPGCNASLNVPATMSNIKCSACGTIWNVANPSAAKRSGSARSQAPGDSDQDDTDDDEAGEESNTGMMITIACSVLTLLVLLGVGMAMLTGGGSKSSNSSNQSSDSDTPTKTQPYEKVKIEFTVVDMPEPQRKKIYYDFRQAAGSTIDQKVFLPGKNKPGGSNFDNTMGAIAKREVTHLALIHRVEDKDIYNIILEGDAKEWPPRKAPTLATP